MRIAIDLTATRSRSTTIYYENMLPELLNDNKKDDFLIFISPDNREISNKEEERELDFKEIRLAEKAILRIAWEQLVLPIYLLAWRADVLLSPWDTTALCSPCSVVLGIHNPFYEVLDAYKFPLKQKMKNVFRVLLTKLSIRRATIIYFPTKAISEEFITKLKIYRKVIRVVNHGLNVPFWEIEECGNSSLKKYGLKRQRFFLFASLLYKQKHPDILIRAFSELVKKGISEDILLVFAGNIPDEHYQKEIHELVRTEGLADRTRFLGLVPHDEMPSLYQNAISVIMPTSKETFGLPYIEAMASGVPIICADIPVAREVCGEAGLYFKTNDVDELSERMIQTTKDEEMRVRLVEKGVKKAREYSWGREASETLGLLEEAFEKRKTKSK